MWNLPDEAQRSDITVRRPSPDVAVLSAHGPVDTLHAPRLRELLRYRLSSCLHALIVDLTDVSYINCAALKVLCEARLRAADQGTLLRVVVVPGGPVDRLMRLACVRNHFAVHSHVDAVLAELPRQTLGQHDARNIRSRRS